MATMQDKKIYGYMPFSVCFFTCLITLYRLISRTKLLSFVVCNTLLVLYE